MPVLPTFLLVVLLAGLLHVRGRDIRMILFLAAAAMYLLRATQPQSATHRWDLFAQYFVDFAKGLTSPASVVPICSAMGFAYVCKFTRCDAHLVHLLVSPLRYVRPLLIPGGIAVAFIVNSAIVSQTSTVAVVGPVLIPLLLAGGVSRKTAGALLLLGGSMGGELLNPAAVEVRTINQITHQDGIAVVRQILPYNLIASATALLIFWLLSFYWQKRDALIPETDSEIAVQPGSIAAVMNASQADPIARIHPFKAVVPLVPILLLLLVKPRIQLPAPFLLPDIGEQASIACAMLIGVACAAFLAHKNLDGLSSAFFEGAGFTFVHVIPVIAGATMFAKGVEMNGLIERLASVLRSAPGALAAATIAIGWLMAMITGTAVGTAPLVINMMLPIAMTFAATPTAALSTASRTGALASVSAQFGRTTSPVAPVTIMCAVLSRQRPNTLVTRVFFPLLAGAIALFLASYLLPNR
jgi:DcuC family C4-dicarboxylate transporter